MTKRIFFAAMTAVMLGSITTACSRSPSEPTWEEEDPDNPDDDPQTKGIVAGLT